VSTAYVNCNRKGFIEEKIYDLTDPVQDPEEVIKNILNMNPQYISDNEKALIGNYPNTYTYTKSMAERSLKKLCGNLKISIVRPSIVIPAYTEPFPGWTDTLAAGGGIIFAVISGLMHVVKTKITATVDFIPVDYVSNLILTTTAFSAQSPKPCVNVLHASTSHLNPIKIALVAYQMLNYATK
jgi:alcohol-forming fatty acyl-CoA reductase